MQSLRAYVVAKKPGPVTMTQLDSQLASLRNLPLPGAIERIEERVFAGIALQQEASIARRGLVLAGAIAMVVGLSASLVPAGKAQAEPLFGVPAQAPSRLLGL